MKAHHMKGQYFSFDAIIASVIFVMALVALLSYWYSVKAYLDNQNDDLSREAVRISNVLFIPSPPLSSRCGDGRVGFAVSWDDKRLNRTLLECARDENNDELLRKHLGYSYNLSILVSPISATRPIQIGSNAPDTATQIVNLYRVASVVDESGTTTLAQVKLTMYK